MRLLKILFAAVLGLVGPTLVWSQSAGLIYGKVEDPSGAAVSGATVIIQNLETGYRRILTTTGAGTFTALSVPIGPEEIRADKAGFESAFARVNLAVGQEAVVNLRFELAEAHQEVTVTEATPVVNITTAPVSGLVGEREVKDLPLNGRSFDNLITLNAGTVNYSKERVNNTTTSNGNAFSVSGQRPGDNLFLLNGIEYTGTSQLAVTPGGVSGDLLGIDAVREFNVLTDTYGAEYGKRSAAQVNIVTQSGTNALHGTAYEFLRNSALDARNYFDPVGDVPPFKQNQFGGAMGGPLVKDHLFLFGDYEGFRQRWAITNVSTVPDANARSGIMLNPTPDPTKCTTTHPCTAMLNPKNYMQLWPQPDPGNSEIFTASGQPSGEALSHNSPKQAIREDFGTLRSDYIIGSRDTLSASYTIDDGNSLVPLADPLFASALAVRNQVVSLQETHLFSPKVLNSFSVGFSRAGFANDSAPYQAFPSDLSFVSGFGPGGISIGGGVTVSANGTITGAGPSNASNVWNRRNLYTFTDNLQVSKGRHQISLGVWLQRLQDNEFSASRQLGQASFTNLQTFLQGTISNFQVVPSATELGWRSMLGAWYVQDAIKLRSNLTLSLGLRHEFTSGWNEVEGRASTYITGANGVLETSPRVADSAFTKNNAKWLLGPRVALAWDVFGNGKTAVRAGYGMYYSLLDALAFQLNSNYPYNGTRTFLGGPLSSIVPITPGAAPLTPCGLGVSPCAKYAPQGVQSDAKTPTVQKWTLSVEQELTPTTTFRLAYVGSFSYHGLLNIDPNTIAAQTCLTLTCTNAGGVASNGLPATPSPIPVPQGALYIPVGTRPNPNLGAGFFWLTEGNSSYNALEAEVTRRVSRSLQLRANYTWSKALDINSGLTGAQAQNQSQMVMIRNDLRADWGPSALNVTHLAHISGTYELPFGKGRRWLADTHGWGGKLTGGWQMNTIMTFASGFPITPQVGSNVSGNGDVRTPDRPSWNPSFTGPVQIQQPVSGSINAVQWFNPQAFTIPAAGTFGNVGRGSMTGPGLDSVDLSMVKNTSISERFNLEFRAEFFNAINHTNLGTPNLVVSGPTAGYITSTATYSRQIQFGLKLIY